MIITLLLILFALAALVFFVFRGFGPSHPPDQIELTKDIREVDVEAFRNLMDPEEEEFLRVHLPAPEFRTIQRQRLRAALDYLTAVSHNAALLLHLGQSARRSADARIALAGQQLVDNALRLRLYSALAICKLCVRIGFPAAVLQPSGIVERYQHMTEGAAQLGRLQYPSNGALISRAL